MRLEKSPELMFCALKQVWAKEVVAKAATTATTLLKWSCMLFDTLSCERVVCWIAEGKDIERGSLYIKVFA